MRAEILSLISRTQTAARIAGFLAAMIAFRHY
jgi:hypothetical protein